MGALLLRALLWVMTRILPEAHTECPLCGPSDTHDDVITPHDCEEGR